MAIYNYGIGGNEVKVDANESIAEIPTLTEVVVIGIKDLDGQIGDAAMSL